jgi:hypothetical protein
VCDVSNLLTVTLRVVAEKFAHVAPELSEYWNKVIGDEPALSGATTSLKPPTVATRLEIFGRPGTELATAAPKVIVAVCSVVPA